jgi:dTDP-4-amino-4,6-dideoxygalactose transaminase
VNSRLDEMQAAILRERLPLLAGWTSRRRELAALYRAALAGVVTLPPEMDPGHVYHLFVMRCAARDALAQHLSGSGIGSLVHYPVPIPKQPAFAAADPAPCPIAEQVCAEVLSLPLYPQLAPADVERVAATVRAFAD